MEMATRVRRGFWRIGLVGAWLGVAGATIAASFALYYWVQTRSTVTVYYEQRFITIRRTASQNELAAALDDSRLSYFDRIGRADYAKTPMDQRIRGLALAADDAITSATKLPLLLAMAALALGLAWLGIWWVLGWIVRGFLA